MHKLCQSIYPLKLLTLSIYRNSTNEHIIPIISKFMFYLSNKMMI